MADFDVLVVDGTNPTGVAMTRDILDAARLFAERSGLAGPTVAFHSPSGGAVRLQGGLSIATRRLPDRASRQAPVLLIPGIWVENPKQLRERLERDDCRRAVRYIRRRAAAGACIAASCSAVFLLHGAGLLRGRCATTTWWLAPELARIAPETQVEGNRILCVDGRVITAGASFAQSDVLLHLLRRRFGAALADAVSRVLLLHERTESAQVVVPSVLASGDRLVGTLAARIESALPSVPSVADLARELCVSERTLGRRVRHATGIGTSALVQSVRLHRARALLQNSRMSVEHVAAAVGYQDASALRRLLQKIGGTTPGRIRATGRVAATPKPGARLARSRPID